MKAETQTFASSKKHKELSKKLKAHINLSEKIRILIEELAKEYKIR
jgi:hypothetical protein